MLKPDRNLTGNARYEGFCIDLLKDVAHLVGFQYTISIVEDGKYGVEDPETKQWNGIVRELLDGVSNYWMGGLGHKRRRKLRLRNAPPNNGSFLGFLAKP